MDQNRNWREEDIQIDWLLCVCLMMSLKKNWKVLTQ